MARAGPQTIRQTATGCEPCATVIRATEEQSSLACFHQHGVLEALQQLRDGYEAEQIDAVMAGVGALIGALTRAWEDGQITGDERAELMILGQRLRGEIEELEQYDAVENAAHKQAADHQVQARARAAITQRALDGAVRAINCRRNGVGRHQAWTQLVAPTRRRGERVDVTA